MRKAKSMSYRRLVIAVALIWVSIGCGPKLTFNGVASRYRMQAEMENGWTFEDCSAEVGSVCLNCAGLVSCDDGMEDEDAIQCMSDAWQSCDPAELLFVAGGVENAGFMRVFSVPESDGECMLVVIREDVDNEHTIELHCRESMITQTCPVVTLAGCDVVDVTETRVYTEW